MTKIALREKTVPGLHEHLVKNLCIQSKAASILDLGCGTGAWLSSLQEKGYSNLSGADRDETQLGITGIEFYPVDMNGAGLNEISGSYDLISAIEFIEHIGDISNLLNFVSSRLSADSQFLVSTPNVNSLASRIRLATINKLRHFDQYGDQTHVTPIFIEPFIRLLGMHGLIVERMWTYPEEKTQFGSRVASKIMIKLLKIFLADPYPGDIMCFIIKKMPTGRNN